jgi:hypothetical protein
MAWPETFRERICSACQWPCAERKTLDLREHGAACPLGRWHAWREETGLVSAAPPVMVERGMMAVPRIAPMEKLGPRLWAELHRRPWSCDLVTEADWLRESFAPRLRGCACRAHWQAALLSAPPDLASHEAYFTWGVARHNEVRRRQGKAELTLLEAYAEWQPGRWGTS